MHTKNYLLSEALMKGCTLAGAKGIAAGQAKADGQYCLITAAEAEALTYIFVVMDAAGENRYNDGTRDFPAENAYNDVKKLFPWATSAFGYSMLLSAEDVVGELPVRLSADADFVTVVPAEPIEVLLPKSTDLSGVERGLNTPPRSWRRRWPRGRSSARSRSGWTGRSLAAPSWSPGCLSKKASCCRFLTR